MPPDPVDVIVVGTGNAAMSAAVAARNEGASVLMLEKGPREAVGGNSFFAGGGFRFAYDGIDDIRGADRPLGRRAALGSTSARTRASKYHDDLMRVTEGLTEPALADRLVAQSVPDDAAGCASRACAGRCMTGRQAFKVGDVYRFWGGLTVEAVGGGPGLIEHWLGIAEAKGVETALRRRRLLAAGRR